MLRLSFYAFGEVMAADRGYFSGSGHRTPDIAWFTMDGKQIIEKDSGQSLAKTLAVFLNGKTIPNPNPRGERLTAIVGPRRRFGLAL